MSIYMIKDHLICDLCELRPTKDIKLIQSKGSNLDGEQGLPILQPKFKPGGEILHPTIRIV